MEPTMNYNAFHQSKYLKYLSTVGALSGLYTDSAPTLVHYRATENIYCGQGTYGTSSYLQSYSL